MSDTEADRLKRLLHKAGEQFAFYGREHRKKGTPDADAKAAVNEAWAERCFAAEGDPPQPRDEGVPWPKEAHSFEEIHLPRRWITQAEFDAMYPPEVVHDDDQMRRDMESVRLQVELEATKRLLRIFQIKTEALRAELDATKPDADQ